jgi:CRP-like cAMP-binding protein
MQSSGALTDDGRGTRASSAVISPAVDRLNAFAPLGDDERQRVEVLGRTRERHAAGTLISRVGSQQRPVARIIISGWACRVQRLPRGGRRRLTVLLPGDAIGLSGRITPLASLDVAAITPVETVDASPLRELALSTWPRSQLALACQRADVFEEKVLLDQVSRLGKTAYERTAHFLLELHERLDVVGLVRFGRFPMPLTQDALASLLGLTQVHVSRTLQKIRGDGLIRLNNGWAEITDLQQMSIAAKTFSATSMQDNAEINCDNFKASL